MYSFTTIAAFDFLDSISYGFLPLGHPVVEHVQETCFHFIQPAREGKMEGLEVDGPLVDISLLSQNLFSGWLHLLKRASAKENCQKGTPPPGRGGGWGVPFCKFLFFFGEWQAGMQFGLFFGGRPFLWFQVTFCKQKRPRLKPSLNPKPLRQEKYNFYTSWICFWSLKAIPCEP